MDATNGASASKTQDRAAELRERARELRQQAEDVRHEVIKQLHNAADKLRSDVRESDADTETRVSMDAIAKGMERAAGYLNSRSLEELGQEAGKKIRRNPGKTFAAIFIVGLIIGILLRNGGEE